MQIAYGGDDEEDRLKAELRTMHEQGRYLLVKESLAGPQRRGREEPKKDSPSTLREFVACFGAEKRYTRG